MNTVGQITIRQWFALPKAERERRAAEFHAADRALQAYRPPAGVPYSDDDPGYVEFNGRVNDLWPTVPWWVRS